MTVWVPHPTRDKDGVDRDLKPAAKFGEVRYINHRYIYSDELRGSAAEGQAIPAQFERHMFDAVVKFDAEQDYLLIAGDMLQLMTLSAMLSQRHGSFNVLRYDRNVDDYVPVRLYSDLAPAGLM